MYENSGFWNDFDCNSYYGYVCEIYKSKQNTESTILMIKMRQIILSVPSAGLG